MSNPRDWRPAEPVIYEVHGPEDGPEIGSFEIDPSGEYSYQEDSVSTANTNVQLTAKVTAVR